MTASDEKPPFLRGDGELSELIAAYPWETTALGAIGKWPAHVRHSVALMLHSGVPMVALYGEAGVMIYNDAYSVFAAGRHPALLGSTVREGWPEVADFNDHVMRVGLAGGTLSYKDQELTLYRNGVAEQVWMDLDYSPIVDESGRPAAVLAIVVETTAKIKAERHLLHERARSEQLQALTAALARAARPEEVIEAAVTLGRAAVGASAGALALLNETADCFTLVAGPGIDPRTASQWQKFACEPQLPATRALSSRRPCYSHTRAEYLARDPRFADAAEALGINADASLPLIVGEQVLGVLMFVFPEPQAFDASQDGHLRAVAEQCAQAIERARLFDAERQARDSLAQSNAEARAAAERVQLALAAGAIVGTWNWDLINDRFSIDERFAESFGVDPAMGRTGLNLKQIIATVHPDDLSGLHAAIAEARARGGPYRHQYRVRRRDGRYHWIEANGRVDHRADGTPERFPGVLLDIEERRALEAQRNQAQQLLRAFIDAVPGVVYAKDLEGRMLVANRGVTELVGKPPEQYLGRTDEEFLYNRAQGAAIMATDRRIIETGRAETVEEEINLPDGRRAVWLSTKAPFLDETGHVIGLIGSSVDISPRKEAEAALRLRTDELSEAQLRLQVALSAARMGVWEWSPITGEAKWNAYMFELLGLPADANASGETFISMVHPEDRVAFDSALARALSTEGEYAVEVRLLTADRHVRWVLGRGRVLYDEQGRPERMVGVNLDITERKAAEQSLLEADRRRNEFIAMLGHELRNPLAPISNAVHLLERGAGKIDTSNAAVQIIKRQTAHMARLLDDLLEVSRVVQGRIELHKETILVSTAVLSAVETVRPLVRERDQMLDIDLAPDLQVVGDPARVTQIVANLLHNAAKYTQPGGRIALSARASDDNCTEIIVSDNGAGIEPDVLPRLFELFSQGPTTLDRARGGLGLGLALVKRLVELHGGSVSAHSPGRGQGATFKVRLPRPHARQAPRSAAVASNGASVAPTKVLVVDDNFDAVETLALLLESEGHQVERATDGEDALSVASHFAPDVVLLDLGLPRLDGWAVARRLREQPATRRAVIIAISGYGQPEDRERSRHSGFDEHLLKPVNVQAVNDAIMRIRAER